MIFFLKLLPQTDTRKQTDFYGKICIKACLEIETTQVVCCSRPKNIYFMLTSTNSFHCDNVPI